MHRLWYDLRSQALYEEAFRADIEAIDKSLENMVWRIASRYAELARQADRHVQALRSTPCSTGFSSATCCCSWRATQRRLRA